MPDFDNIDDRATRDNQTCKPEPGSPPFVAMSDDPIARAAATAQQAHFDTMIEQFSALRSEVNELKALREEIKDLKSKNSSLEDKINVLEKKNQELENRISSLEANSSSSSSSSDVFFIRDGFKNLSCY